MYQVEALLKIVRPWSGGSKVETCVVYKKMYCKAFGGSRVKTRRCISRQEDVF